MKFSIVDETLKILSVFFIIFTVTILLAAKIERPVGNVVYQGPLYVQPQDKGEK